MASTTLRVRHITFGKDLDVLAGAFYPTPPGSATQGTGWFAVSAAVTGLRAGTPVRFAHGPTGLSGLGVCTTALPATAACPYSWYSFRATQLDTEAATATPPQAQQPQGQSQTSGDTAGPDPVVEARRVRLVRLSHASLLSLLRLDGRQVVEVLGLPADATIVSVADEPHYNAVLVKVRSTTFVPVSEYGPIALIDLKVNAHQLRNALVMLAE